MLDSEDFNKKSIAGLMFLHEHLGFTFVIHNGRIEKRQKRQKIVERIENRMVVDSRWLEVPLEVKEKLNKAGYRELCTGIFVPGEDALEYATEKLSWDADLQKEFVEWFYSGNWVKEE